MAAPAGHGKTQMMLCLAMGHARRGLRVSFVSFGMSDREMRVRYLSRLSGVPYARIENGRTRGTGLTDDETVLIRGRARKFRDMANGGLISLHCQPGENDLPSLLADIAARDAPDVIYLDHAGLPDGGGDGGSERRRLEGRVIEAAGFARARRVPVIMATRATDAGSPDLPSLLARHADHLWRWTADMDRGVLDIRQIRNRGGERFPFRLAIRPELSKVSDMPGESVDPKGGAGDGPPGRDATVGTGKAGRNAEVRRLYATGRYRQRDLADRFGVGLGTINRIVREGRRDWEGFGMAPGSTAHSCKCGTSERDRRHARRGRGQ